ncbi:Wzz/FepE/Etk N-terminal domain-containing protein [Blastococcus sp. SYSU DS0619]
MTFRDLFSAVRRGWLVVVVAVLVGGAAATAWTVTRTPEYVSTAQLFLGVRTATEAEDTRQDTLYLQQRMQSYAAVLGSPALGARVADELDLELGGADVAERMDVTVPEGTVLLMVEVHDSSAERAQAIANTVGAEFAGYLAELENSGGSDIDAVDVITIEPAELPEAPASPDAVVNVLAGLLLGLAVGLGLAFLRAALDDRVRTADDVAAPGLRTLGEVPARARGRAPVSAEREDGLRRLRLHLLTDEQRRKDLRVVALTAPAAGCDIGAMALDLARSLVATGESVILVDADLATPCLPRLLDLPADRPGFAELLAGSVDPQAVLVPDVAGLRVVPAGHPARHPADLVLPEPAERVLRTLARLADRVVVAGPPLDGPAEAEVIATANDGVVLLLSGGTTRRTETETAVRTLGALGADLLGYAVERQRTR